MESTVGVQGRGVRYYQFPGISHGGGEVFHQPQPHHGFHLRIDLGTPQADGQGDTEAGIFEEEGTLQEELELETLCAPLDRFEVL